MLDIDELLELEEILRTEIDENLEHILVKLNAAGKLKDLLSLLDMGKYLETDEDNMVIRDGKLIVIGQSEVGKEQLIGVAKNLGFSKDRFEFYLNYDDAKNFDFRKTQWSSQYSCILVGEMPHSGKIKGNYRSIISALENQEGYPPVVRIGGKKLKITKTSFREALEYLVSEKKIA